MIKGVVLEWAMEWKFTLVNMKFHKVWDPVAFKIKEMVAMVAFSFTFGLV